MKTIDEALALMMSAYRPLGVERVPLMNALGRVVAETVHARFSMPSAHLSAMDGYALSIADLSAQGGSLPLHGESRAGMVPSALSPKTTMRILTGAVVPEGADAVVPQENITVSGSSVVFGEQPKLWANIRKRGEDTEEGQPILSRGMVLGPGEIAMLAGHNYAQVSVYRRPRVAIVSTGDELVDIGDTVGPGRIVNTNAYALAAAVQEAGAEPWILPAAKDDVDVIAATIREALAADVVLTSGGVSVGDYDFVHDAFEKVGAQRALWKVAIKPGKPVAFGLSGSVPTVGLPGNPISAMVTFELFVRPGLRAMLGDPRPFKTLLPVRLAAPHRHKPGRLEFVRVRVERQDAEGVWVSPLSNQGSGSLPSMVGAEGLVLLAADQAEFAQGEAVSMIPLQGVLRQTAVPYA